MYKSFLVVFLLLSFMGCSMIPIWSGNHKKNGNKEQEMHDPTVIVFVSGVDKIISNNVLAHVGISKNRCTTPVTLLKRRNKKTMSEVISALQSYGYYEAKININYSDTPECPTAEINIEPGRRMLISKIDILIEGMAKDDPDFTKLVRDIPIKEGKELNHNDYSETKTIIDSAAAELGYLDGRFTRSVLTIDIEHYQAEVFIKYESGERYLLGRVNIQQEPKFLNDSLIERLIEAPVGSKYTADKVIDIQDRLLASNYFKSVETRPRLSKTEDHMIPVDVNVHAIERHKFQASLGFATDEGLRSRLGYTNSRLNARGHRLGAETKLSQSELGVSVNYQIPRKHPSNEWLQIIAGSRRQDFDTYNTLTAKVSVTESKRRFWDIMENHFITLSRDDFEIGNEKGIGTFLIPGVRWNRRFVDNEIYTEHGLDLNLEFRGATDTLISDTSFIRSSFHVHYVRALPFQFRIFLRGDLGGMLVDDFRALPPSERFFAGGDNSLRGYDYQELGPVNAEGHVIGGSYLGITSLELEKYLSGNWGVAAFVDTGNAFGGPGRNTGLKTGLGLGLRWRSPVGPVRVDFAHPLDDDDTLVRVHLRIGPDL